MFKRSPAFGKRDFGAIISRTRSVERQEIAEVLDAEL